MNSKEALIQEYLAKKSPARRPNYLQHNRNKRLTRTLLALFLSAALSSCLAIQPSRPCLSRADATRNAQVMNNLAAAAVDPNNRATMEAQATIDTSNIRVCSNAEAIASQKANIENTLAALPTGLPPTPIPTGSPTSNPDQLTAQAKHILENPDLATDSAKLSELLSVAQTETAVAGK